MLGLEHRHCLLFACQLTDRTGAAPAVKGEPTPLVGPPPRSRGYRLQMRGLGLDIGSGIHPAINGEIRPGNVRGLRTGDERHQRGDLINMPIAVERCGDPLRNRPIARRGMQISVDWTGWSVNDRTTLAS